MWKIRTLVVLIASGWLASPAVSADSFDDAVNLYLKGFDQCAEAKSALSANDLAKARSAFAKYESTRQKAVALDGSILTSSQRGMDSNLKYCNRVGTDIEVATGMPTLDKALAACDQANADLKAGKLDPAKTNYQQFIGLRDQALAMAPSLNNVFSARSEIRRCERLEAKIAGFGKEQAALTLAVQSAMDDSETLQTACESALTELNGAASSPQALQAGRQALTKAQGHQKNVAADMAALEKVSKGVAVPEQKTLDSRVAKGSQCIGQLTAAVATKERQLQTAQAELDRRGAQLKKANQTCSAITSIDSNRASQTQYDQARTDFEAARKTRDEVKAALASNPMASDGSATARNLEEQVTKLDACLDDSRPHLAAMLTAMTNAKAAAAKAAAPAVVAKAESVAAAPAVAVPSVAKSAPTASAAIPAAVAPAAVVAAPAAPPAKLTPVSALKGKVQITDILPDFVLVYWQDGTQPEKDIDVLVHPTGFDKKIYVMAPGGSIKLRSKDFSGHSISALQESSGVSQSLASLGSMQSRSVDVKWPDNSLMVLRSDKSRVAESYVANISSATYAVLHFAGNSNSVSIDLKNPNGATKGYLLMPNYDPVAFDIGRGQDKSLAVSRNNISVGTVTLSGN